MRHAKVHFGFRGMPGENGKVPFRLFLCPGKKNLQTKEVLVRCAECDRIASVLEQKEALLEDLAKQRKTQEQVDEKTRWRGPRPGARLAAIGVGVGRFPAGGRGHE